MKKNITRFFAIVAMVSFAAVACSKTEQDITDENPDGSGSVVDDNNPQNPATAGSITLIASVENAEMTKTSLGAADESGNRTVSWALGDEVKVLYDGGTTTATAADPDGAQAKFSFDAPDGDVWLAYPSAATSSLGGEVLSLTVPAEQDGSFATHGYLVAKANTAVEGVKFFNACSMFKIVVADAALKKAVITGNNGEALAGTVKYTWEGANNAAPTVDVTAATETSLTVTFNGAGEYYVAALPGLNLTTGVTIMFYKEGETPGTYDLAAGGNRTSNTLSVERAHIASFGSSDAICHRYVTTAADGSGNGRTSATAWNADQFSNFLGGKWNGTDTDNTKLLAMNGITIHFAEGEYVLADPAIMMDVVDSESPASQFTHLTIVGDDGAILKGNGSKPILHQNYSQRSGTTVEFRNLTFTGGVRTNDHGGAVWQSFGNFKYKDCTFSGNSVTGSGKNGGVLHYYQTAAAVFEDCTFTGNSAAGTNENGGTSNGGVLNVTDRNNLTFMRCHFYNNTATQDGGVANVSGTNAVLRFEDCDFGDGSEGNLNSATNYGGVFHIEKAKELYIVNCRFNNNTAKGGGALNFPSSSNVGADAIHVQGCSFTNHSASEAGGVIRMVAGTLNLEKNGTTPCTFTENSVPNTKSGGVMYFAGAATLNDKGSVYKKNNALWGGVVAVQTDVAVTINMEECIFGTDGTAGDKNYAENGGGVLNLNGGTVNLTKCEFYGNEAQNRQGGVLRRSTDGEGNVAVTIKGCTFKGNLCSYTDKDGCNGGAISFDKGSLTIQKADDGTRNTFLNNTSLYRGGAIEVGGTATAKIMESDFTGNTTTGGNYTQIAGGALNVGNTAVVEVTDCTFIGNKANTAGYGGGAIGTAGTPTLKFNKCLFKNNYAKQGGALANYSKGTIYMNACAFTGNYSSSTYGCVIVLPDAASAAATLCMNNCSFADNQYSEGATTGQQCAWVNMKGLTKVVLSNSSLIGVTRKTASKTEILDGNNPNLFRFDGNKGTGNYIINSIIAIKSEASGNYYSSDMQSSPVTGFYNKLSAVRGGGSYTPGNGSASDFRGTSTYFGGLGTDMTEGSAATDCYWSWNGTLATGSDLTKAALADVNSTINTADSGFYSWLDSIGALTTDCRGKARSTTATWPGAYDGSNN